MARWMLPLAAIGAVLPLTPAPALAQSAVQNGVLIIYGNDKCPTDSNGNEIVVCARRPETERYRIPKELRDLKIAPENRSWAVKQEQVLDTGKTGIGSCSAVGPGGGIGCSQQTIARGSQEAKERQHDAENLPLPK
ncbi:hypothetical protein [Stakelama marina]|uniref:DUF4189 domain-containing protein n=1 Tax=Stakelama marina TaxID=2826939 RepID=A0A8T4IEE4_9SPHN|nr:hypothetical protein [Stakelama marina]MBR0552930.1 hypothetical protein [Stakelama marina]